MSKILHGIPLDASQIVDENGEITYDNVYFSKDFADWAKSYFGNGIVVPKAETITTQFQIEEQTNTSIKINPGIIVINGRTGFLDEYHVEDLDPIISTTRIDRIVVELNLTESVNAFRVVVLKGEESSTPTAPELTRNESAEIWQLSLARVLISATGITSIVDERIDDNLCGISQVLIGVKPPKVDEASSITYDGSSIGFDAKNVQEAITRIYNGEIKILNPNNPLDIEHGGTGANTAADARTNLGFTYGTTNPTAEPETGEGSLYFKVDSGDPLSIEEGGTGAATVADALNNLGISDALKIQTVNPNGWTIPANSARGSEIKGTIDGYEGYTPIVFACYCINAYGVLIINAWVSGSYNSAGGGFTWNIDARNVTSSSVTADFTLRILWIKNGVLG